MTTKVYFCKGCPAEDEGDEDVSLCITLNYQDCENLIRQLRRQMKTKDIIQVKMLGVMHK